MSIQGVNRGVFTTRILHRLKASLWAQRANISNQSVHTASEVAYKEPRNSLKQPSVWKTSFTDFRPPLQVSNTTCNHSLQTGAKLFVVNVLPRESLCRKILPSAEYYYRGLSSRKGLCNLIHEIQFAKGSWHYIAITYTYWLRSK